MVFFSPHRHEFLRISACVPRVEVGDPDFNVSRTLELAREGDKQKIGVMIFPELGISAYAIDDLLFQDALLDKVEKALDAFRWKCARLDRGIEGERARLGPHQTLVWYSTRSPGFDEDSSDSSEGRTTARDYSC